MSNPERLPPTSETAQAIAFVLETIAIELRRPPSPKWAEVLRPALGYLRECETTLSDVVAQLDAPEAPEVDEPSVGEVPGYSSASDLPIDDPRSPYHGQPGFRPGDPDGYTPKQGGAS